jgi:hypothetical protein
MYNKNKKIFAKQKVSEKKNFSPNSFLYVNLGTYDTTKESARLHQKRFNLIAKTIKVKIKVSKKHPSPNS